MQAPRSKSVSLLLPLFLLGACKTPAPATETPTGVSAAASVPAPSASAAVPVDAEATLAPLVNAWIAAQNSGDFAKYLSFYDEGNFHGVKRLGEGGEKTYTFATWKADREKMVLGKATVVADNRRFHASTKGETLEVTFTQRFRQGAYEDHGKKVLTFTKGAAGWKITREEMKTSSAGFDDPKTVVKEIDLSARPGPLTVSLRWEPGKPTAGAPEGFSSRRLVLGLVDAKGKKESYDLFQETNDRPVTLGPLVPKKGTTGILFEELFWWAGAGDGFRVVVDAEHLVVKHKIQEEGGSEGEGGFDGPYNDELRIAVPAGGVKTL